MTEMDHRPPPAIITQMAMELQYYFEQQGVEDWCFMGICSRKAYEKLRDSALRVTSEQTLRHIVGK